MDKWYREAWEKAIKQGIEKWSVPIGEVHDIYIDGEDYDREYELFAKLSGTKCIQKGTTFDEFIEKDRKEREVLYTGMHYRRRAYRGKITYTWLEDELNRIQNNETLTEKTL